MIHGDPSVSNDRLREILERLKVCSGYRISIRESRTICKELLVYRQAFKEITDQRVVHPLEAAVMRAKKP